MRHRVSSIILSIRLKRLDARVHLWDPSPRYQTACMQAGVYRLQRSYRLRGLQGVTSVSCGVRPFRASCTPPT